MVGDGGDRAPDDQSRSPTVNACSCVSHETTLSEGVEAEEGVQVSSSSNPAYRASDLDTVRGHPRLIATTGRPQ